MGALRPLSTECCCPCVWREREQEPGPAQALTVASAPWPAEPLLLLRQYRPSWLTSQHVWMCCLAGNVCATCSSRLSHTLQGTTEPKGTLRHHHHHGFPLCPPTHPAVPTCSALAAPKLSLHPCIHPCWITLQLSVSQILLFTTQSCFQPIPGRTLHSKAQVSWQVAFSNQPHNSPVCLRLYLPSLWPQENLPGGFIL